jgi:acyl carrier protein
LSTPLFTPDELSDILSQYVGLGADQQPDDPDTPFGEVGLDSLAIVALQYGVEQRYEIEVPDGDACYFTSPASVLTYVNERLATVRS